MVITPFGRLTHRADGCYQDPQRPVRPQADLVAGHANNAGIAGPEHLDFGSLPQAKFLDALHTIRLPDNPRHKAGLTGLQKIQRYHVIHKGHLGAGGRLGGK